jgi:hypothetical protein
MKYVLSGLLLTSALASQAQAVSHHDRVYTAD